MYIIYIYIRIHIYVYFYARINEQIHIKASHRPVEGNFIGLRKATKRRNSADLPEKLRCVCVCWCMYVYSSTLHD